MTDVVGTRAVVGVIMPSTNTIVEHDYSMLQPPGVTFHYGRSYITEPDLDSDSAFDDLIKAIEAGNENALRDVLTCKPDYMTMGMSAETFWDGAAGNEKFEAHIRDVTQLGVTTGATAVRTALETYGAKKLAFVSPYMSVGDDHVIQYFTDHGYEITAHHGLKCESATAMGRVTEDELVKVLLELNESNPDVIVQTGTNLSMLRLADAAERFLRKPVIAINAACVWHTLRQLGINDQMTGFGSLLRDH
ncbi:MAG: Asp/Glu/hydantoin racemase [Marmoricola sp.]|nr:Asp/Glu/hydantoin racemase [Marmoricola sp.]